MNVQRLTRHLVVFAAVLCLAAFTGCDSERSYPDAEDNTVHLTDDQKIEISTVVKRKFIDQGVHDYFDKVLKVPEIKPLDFVFLSSRDSSDGDVLFRYRMTVRVVYDDLDQRRYVGNIVVGGKGRYFKIKDQEQYDASFERKLESRKMNRVKAYSGAP